MLTEEQEMVLRSLKAESCAEDAYVIVSNSFERLNYLEREHMQRFLTHVVIEETGDGFDGKSFRISMRSVVFGVERQHGADLAVRQDILLHHPNPEGVLLSEMRRMFLEIMSIVWVDRFVPLLKRMGFPK